MIQLILKLFGYLCYAQTITSHRDKFQLRANPCIFLGYPPNHRGYRLYNLKHKNITISYDVTFVEHIFSFQSHTPPTHPSLVLPLPISDTISSSYPHITFELDLPHSTSPPPPICPRCTINRPSHLRDYFCPTLSSSTAFSTHSNTSSSTTHPLSHFVSYSKFSPTHYIFLSMLSQSIDPSSYSQAIKHSHWRDAMQTEIQALKANNTWTLTSLPSGKKPIGCKWVFKTKLCVDGLIERHKSRLVAKGYHDTFALVAKLVMVCCVFFIAAARHWHLYKLDVNNAFLYVDLDEEVYMTLPLGYGQKGESCVCRLLKSLYGLKQASRN